MGEMIERRCWWIVAGIAAIGLALRVAAAQGGLWLDEAWSAVMADQAGTPLAVILNINHDNNHHLNTLWLQFVGIDAPPPLQRALSIATGTASIFVAALIGARRGVAAAIVAALLFALSPILVTYGSEARGYAPMLLALLTAIALVDRWLADPAAPPPATALAIALLLGLLGNLTMLFGLAALIAWAAVELYRTRDAAGTLRPLARLLGPATITTAIALALILLAANGRLAAGAVQPFSSAAFSHGLIQLLDYTLGDLTGLIALLVVAAAAPAGPRDRLASFCALSVLAFPLAIALLQLPNAGNARYLLLAATGLLVAVQIALAPHAAHNSWHKWLAFAALAVLLAFMLHRDWTVIRDHRADPAQALAAIAARAPTGAEAAVERTRSDAILIAAAAAARYPLQVRQACPAARFLFVERDGAEPFPAAPIRCDARYREIAGDTVQGLSGTQWKLYERSAR